MQGGSTTYLIANCPFNREYFLRKRITELEGKFQKIEAANLSQLESKQKREQLKRKKELKRRKRNTEG